MSYLVMGLLAATIINFFLSKISQLQILCKTQPQFQLGKSDHPNSVTWSIEMCKHFFLNLIMFFLSLFHLKLHI